MPEAKQMQKEGLVDYIGFSTHGDTPLILDVIATDLFDYVNIHYHFCGMLMICISVCCHACSLLFTNPLQVAT